MTPDFRQFLCAVIAALSVSSLVSPLHAVPVDAPVGDDIGGHPSEAAAPGFSNALSGVSTVLSYRWGRTGSGFGINSTSTGQDSQVFTPRTIGAAGLIHSWRDGFAARPDDIGIFDTSLSLRAVFLARETPAPSDGPLVLTLQLNSVQTIPLPPPALLIFGSLGSLVFMRRTRIMKS